MYLCQKYQELKDVMEEELVFASSVQAVQELHATPAR